MAKEFVPAWRRTVLAVLQSVPLAVDGKSAWEGLSQDERQAMRSFIIERNENDEEKAKAMLEQTFPLVKVRKPMAKGLMIALLAVAGIAAAVAAAMLVLMGQEKLLFAGLAVLAAAALVWLLCRAKFARMSIIWNRRGGSQAEAEKALKAMYYTALRSPVAAVNKRIAGLALAMLLLFAVLTALPEPPPTEAELLAEKIGQVTAGQAVMADARKLLADAQEDDGLDLIRQAMRHTLYGSDEKFLLAALLWMHIEDNAQLGLSDYAVGTAGDATYEALETTAPSQIDNPEEIAALLVLLEHAGTQQGTTLDRFLQQPMLPEGVLSAFGAAMRTGRTVQEMIALSDKVTAAGHDPLPFFQAGLGSVTFEEGKNLIASADSDEHRALLIKGIAPAITDVDEVLAFIRLAKEYGVSAAECYPKGAVITLDTSKWDPSASARALSLGKRDTFLVIRRTENAEPFTTFAVPEGQETDKYEELPDALYEDYDPDEELGMAQYTVMLETSVLDRMPQERIPAAMAECDVVIILDARYWCDGYVRFTRSSWKDNAWRHRQIDAPTFALWQEIGVYRVKTGEWIFSYKDKITNSPAMLEKDLAGKDVLEWKTEDHYIAALDEAWMAETYADFLYALERRNWLLVP